MSNVAQMRETLKQNDIDKLFSLLDDLYNADPNIQEDFFNQGEALTLIKQITQHEERYMIISYWTALEATTQYKLETWLALTSIICDNYDSELFRIILESNNINIKGNDKLLAKSIMVKNILSIDNVYPVMKEYNVFDSMDREKTKSLIEKIIGEESYNNFLKLFLEDKGTTFDIYVLPQIFKESKIDPIQKTLLYSYLTKRGQEELSLVREEIIKIEGEDKAQEDIIDLLDLKNKIENILLYKRYEALPAGENKKRSKI